MARVVLITTGSMEELAFPRSLARLFPDHEFIARPRMDGFTSATLPPDYAALRDKRPLLNIEKFARTLIGLFAGGRKDQPRPDFVLALDDMELVNAAAPENITRALRARAGYGVLALALTAAAVLLGDEARLRSDRAVRLPVGGGGGAGFAVSFFGGSAGTAAEMISTAIGNGVNPA